MSSYDIGRSGFCPNCSLKMSDAVSRIVAGSSSQTPIRPACVAKRSRASPSSNDRSRSASSATSAALCVSSPAMRSRSRLTSTWLAKK